MRAYCSGERHFDVYGLVHLKPGRTPDEWPDLAAYRDPECFVAFWRPDLIADDDEEEDDGDEGGGGDDDDDEVEEWAGDPEAWREGRGG